MKTYSNTGNSYWILCETAGVYLCSFLLMKSHLKLLLWKFLCNFIDLHMVGGFELMKFTVVVNEGETCEIHVSDKIRVLFASGGCGV
jgi:hypothetical protein